MEKITKIVNNNTYEFINEYWETHNAWGHKTNLLKNGKEIATNKVRYYNRTWESYEYQTCMRGCLDKLINEREAILRDMFLKQCGITRLGKHYKTMFEELKNNDETIMELNKLLEEIR